VILADASPGDFSRLLREGVTLQIGEYVARIRSELPEVARGLHQLYGTFPLLERGFADFHVEVRPVRRLRNGLSAEAAFLFDGQQPFLPLPRAQSFAFLEWGLNWCVGAHVLDHLVLHAAVVEKGGRAAILPGSPGSGKSTLCAALVVRGWRLLSDEFALVALRSARLAPLPRPISLKNASIGLIRERDPSAVLSEPVRDTRKGDVAHMAPKPRDVARMREAADAAWIVYPTYREGAGATLTGRDDASSFAALIQNSFNYEALGEDGFFTVGALVWRCSSFELAFSDLDEACDAVENLPIVDGREAAMADGAPAA
jgi:HprK-related kinase A